MSLHKLVKRLLFFALAVMLGSAAATALPWPDPKKSPRVILYADQMLVEQYMHDHPEWFQHDFLVGGFYIKDVVYGESDAAIKKSGFLRQTLRRKRILYGSYISGTTVIHELSLTKYPADAVSIEDLPPKMHYLGAWLRQPDQTVVDLSDTYSREELQKAIHQLWQHTPSLMRFIDNAAVHPRVALLQPWDAYCKNMAELRDMAEAAKANVIFNVFVRPWELSDKEVNQLTAAVGPGNAISLPLPWSKSIKDDKTANAWAIYRYRQILKSGVVVILIPSDDAPIEELIHWTSTWKKPNDHIYYASPIWEAPW